MTHAALNLIFSQFVRAQEKRLDNNEISLGEFFEGNVKMSQELTLLRTEQPNRQGQFTSCLTAHQPDS